MIYVTGDTHGEFGRFSKKKLRVKGMELTADDYVIVYLSLRNHFRQSEELPAR